MASPNEYEYQSSEEEIALYENALMDHLSVSVKPAVSLTNKPTDERIQFARSVLAGKELTSMIDFDNFNTENAISTQLNKKIVDIETLFATMNVSLKYLKSGTTGHTFKAVSKLNKDVSFAVKVCAYPKDEYGGMNNVGRPENAELRMIKLLSYFVIKKCTPHFVLPIGSFNSSITHFVRIPKTIIDLDDTKNDAYRKFIHKFNEGKFENFVSVLISEWCNGGDLLDYIRKNYPSMTLKCWTIIFFQILFSLSLIHQKYPTFRHNDMKANNILVQLTNIKKDSPTAGYRYNINDTKFIIPNINLQIKIWDFDFACISDTIENNKVNANWTKKIGISRNKNRYYDMHYFFNTLISEHFFPQFYTHVPKPIIDFVKRIIPDKFRNDPKFVNKKGRIQVDTEYTTPYQVIMKDPLFARYRFSATSS